MNLFFIPLILLTLASPARAGTPTPPLHHPVGVIPSKRIQPPKEFPLDDKGALACETCHAVNGIEQWKKKKIDKTAAGFLRQGPYERLSGFCKRCHPPQGLKRLNIHVMHDGHGRLLEKNCLYCHQKRPSTSGNRRPRDLLLRKPAAKLCGGCHPGIPHLNAITHRGRPNQKMVAVLRENEKRLAVTLPLDNSGAITCITCHTPHAPGLLPGGWPGGKRAPGHHPAKGLVHRTNRWSAVFAADKEERLRLLEKKLNRPVNLVYTRADADPLLRLPAGNGVLCQACHRFEE